MVNDDTKKYSLTTYHVGADPVSCDNNQNTENCSYIETDRSAHNGEVLKLLKDSNDLGVFDFYNVMAYDAGPNFKWKTAIENYAKAIGGDKSKVVLGLTINKQWGPNGRFVESEDELAARAKWTKDNSFGGVFLWTFGANTESLSSSDQVDSFNRILNNR